ncbi:MAG: hypothetical protein KF752_01860 [Pirellulaceae bacterium]|nr:hypothetical protein [Pirellulaceae bacterium]
MEARRLRPVLGLVLSVCLSAAVEAQFLHQAIPPAAHMHAAYPGPMMSSVTPQMLPGMAPNMMPFSVPVMSPAQLGPSVVRGTTPAPRRSQFVAHSTNFIVFASESHWAQQVAEAAESQRQELAMHWFGHELPDWSQRCPIHVQDSENLGAGGETRFALSHGIPGNWMMSVQGTRERILDSVLPHEITHTLLATYFGRLNKYVPRWADEGAATTVEHEAEKQKHRHFLRQFLKSGRGLAFNEMFRLKEYPQDILPLYAQGHSAVQFLLDQAGPHEFIQFLNAGMRSENWPQALAQTYGYQSIGDFQVNWNQWLIDDSPKDLLAYAPRLRRQQSTAADVQLASAAQSSAPPLRDRQQALSLSPSHASDPLAMAGSAAVDSATSASTQDPSAVPLILPERSQSLISLDQAIALAAAQPIPSAVQDRPEPLHSQAADAANDSQDWYKRKLHSTSGQPATPIPPHNLFPGDGQSAHRPLVLPAARNGSAMWR